MTYLGRLSPKDPMWAYLCDDILPLVDGANGSDGTVVAPDFEVYRMPLSRRVYLYEDRARNARIIGKFFGGDPGRSFESAVRHMEREHHHLNQFRMLGFDRYPHYVARPLGCNARINCVLVEEFLNGQALTHVILDAIGKQNPGDLLEKLADLAWFLAALHQRSMNKHPVDMAQTASYFKKVIRQLRDWKHIDEDPYRNFLSARDRWLGKAFMSADRQVLVHGDITPANILFGDSPGVMTFDLENVKADDPVFDLGRLAGELRHFFMQYAGDSEKAVPFIRHVLQTYAGQFSDPDCVFSAVTRRVPFYEAMTLLRISRNSWISDAHRKRLIEEAGEILGGG
ncbi:MAG: aminoglycoside phosphotransferase family protein [Desulfobacterales bacterium]|nr:aminoglycoside phosphotransferase family protein [Desulfobacterales bacterium]MDD4073363.1 aminoglycoside phosphotransferase family protein [Desulfobacterales bacterium]MDD4393262.1 aminoglycoside phosphotransferase family protein [Desulfobacterales bacterium]